MEKTVNVFNGATLKVPKGATKVRVQTTKVGVSIVWKWSI